MTKYEEFLQRKLIIDPPTGIAKPGKINPALFEFQRAIVKWALRRGRAALFEGTGLGKTPQQCEWARHVEAHTEKPVLILAPLAVSHQTIGEAKKILGMDVALAMSAKDVKSRGVYVTNYQRLHLFDGSVFGGVVADESSCIKSQGSATLELMKDMFGQTPFRLCCTATPAPNDFMELGQHSDFLGIMSMPEMLSTFFIHDSGETQTWRLKGHAQSDFWKWLASWSVCITKPSDIGFSDEGYDLPPLNIHEIIVESGPCAGELFAVDASSLDEQRQVRRETLDSRVSAIKGFVNGSGESWAFWSGLNCESEAVTKAIPDCVEVTGGDEDGVKESRLLGFAAGKINRLSTKAKIAGWGLNLQVCHKCVFVGIDHSFESLYQVIRRFWRFGQKHPVDVYLVMSDRDGSVIRNIKRKQADAEKMQQELVAHMADITKTQLGGTSRTKSSYNPKQKMEIPLWLKTQK